MSSIATSWRIELFGGLRASRGKTVLTHFETRKVDALMALLALRPERAQSREMLAEQLWPDEDLDATRNRFRHALSSLRHALEPSGIEEGTVLNIDRMEVGLAAGACEIDTQEFELAHREQRGATGPDRIDVLRRMVTLYQGELMPGYYEEQIGVAREAYAEWNRQALHDLSSLLSDVGETNEALDHARAAVRADPLREETQRLLISLYARSERLPEALRQYRSLERLLREELGASPAAETCNLMSEIRSRAAQTGLTKVRETDPHVVPTDLGMEAEGGAVPLDSPYYIERLADEKFEKAVLRRDSIVLVKGARQTGKTSLLARGMQRARETGRHVALSDLQDLTSEQLESPDSLFFALAEGIVEQLDIEVALDELWAVQRGWNVKFERFLRREVLSRFDTPVVWALDEVDRLFGLPFSSEAFGMFRSWHNQRALNPASPWGNLTLAITYATEAHLFITDLNQSPFNVGTRLMLGDLTLGEVAELNRRYHSPLCDEEEVDRFFGLVGGNPYLVRRGLNILVTEGPTLAEVEADAAREHGLFGDHLRRMLAALRRDPDILRAMQGVLRGDAPAIEHYYRLYSAGLIVGETPAEARPRCRLYADFLARHLS